MTFCGDQASRQLVLGLVDHGPCRRHPTRQELDTFCFALVEAAAEGLLWATGPAYPRREIVGSETPEDSELVLIEYSLERVLQDLVGQEHFPPRQCRPGSLPSGWPRVGPHRRLDAPAAKSARSVGSGMILGELWASGFSPRRAHQGSVHNRSDGFAIRPPFIPGRIANSVLQVKRACLTFLAGSILENGPDIGSMCSLQQLLQQAMLVCR